MPSVDLYTVQTLEARPGFVPDGWEIYVNSRPIAGNKEWAGRPIAGGAFFAAINPDEEGADERRIRIALMGGVRVDFISRQWVEQWGIGNGYSLGASRFEDIKRAYFFENGREAKTIEIPPNWFRRAFSLVCPFCSFRTRSNEGIRRHKSQCEFRKEVVFES